MPPTGDIVKKRQKRAQNTEKLRTFALGKRIRELGETPELSRSCEFRKGRQHLATEPTKGLGRR